MKLKTYAYALIALILAAAFTSCGIVDTKPKFMPKAYNAGREEEARRNPISTNLPYLSTTGWIERKNENNGITRINPGTGEMVSSARSNPTH
jgi:hypothetical protein